MQQPKPKILLISFSGGRTSAYMTYQILSGSLKDEFSEKYDEIIPVFMNTGAEHPDTYRFIKDCVSFWQWEKFTALQYKINENRPFNSFEILPIDALNKNGELFKNVAKQYPNFSFIRTCTRELKKRVFDKFVAMYFRNCEVTRAIGIRADEMQRYKQKDGYIYPLIENIPSTKPEILDFFSDFDFDLKIPEYLGNCVFCFCKSEKKLCKAIQEMKETPLYQNWCAMDKFNPQASYRNYKKFQDLVNLSNELVINDLFAETWTGGCSESCEIFDLD